MELSDRLENNIILGNLKIIKQELNDSLEKLIDIDIQRYLIRTAIRHHKYDISEYLIDHFNFDMDTQAGYNYTLLMSFIEEIHGTTLEQIQYIVDKTKNINLMDYARETALDKTMTPGTKINNQIIEDVIVILLERGSNVLLPHYRDSFLAYIVESNNYNILTLILKHSKINIIADAFILAVKFDNYDFAELLVNTVDIGDITIDGLNLLQYVRQTEQPNADIIELIESAM